MFWLKQTVKKHLAGRAGLQPVFEQLHRVALSGMNFGGGSDVRFSGESVALTYLARRLPEGAAPVIFDVGANVGNYSRQVLSIFGERVRLYCFEPSSRAFESLSENLRGHDRVRLHNFGFGDRAERATLYADAAGSGLASVYARRLEHIGIEMAPTEAIELRRLDDFCQENGIERIDLLKLDAEGHELKILEGAQRLRQANAIDLIQFEFGSCNIDSRTYFRDFFSLFNPNYRLFRVLTNGLAAVDRYRETYEVFLTTNYLAVSRKMQPRPSPMPMR